MSKRRGFAVRPDVSKSRLYGRLLKPSMLLAGLGFGVRNKHSHSHCKSCFVAVDFTRKLVMTFAVAKASIRCKYTDCVDVCLVDAFCEGLNFLAIDPSACIDCAVCVPECPVEAIFADDDVPDDQQSFILTNERLGSRCKPITRTKLSLPDAEQWPRDKHKRQWLEERRLQPRGKSAYQPLLFVHLTSALPVSDSMMGQEKAAGPASHCWTKFLSVKRIRLRSLILSSTSCNLRTAASCVSLQALECSKASKFITSSRENPNTWARLINRRRAMLTLS